MANKRFWPGILALALVFGMTVVGCDDGSADTEEIVNLPSTSGEFTFTDIPAKYNGKFVLVEGYFSDSTTSIMIGYKGATRNTSNPDYFSTLTCVKIENGTVRVPLYKFYQYSPASSMEAYTGNDSAYVNILIYDSEVISATTTQSYTAVAVFGTVYNNTPATFPVQFASGKASKSNNDATVPLY